MRWSVTALLIVALSVSVAVAGLTPSWSRVDLQTPGGDRTSLARVADGQRLAVVVYKADWCRVCAEQQRRLEQLRGELARRDTRLVGLVATTTVGVREVMTRGGLSTPVLADPTHGVIAALGLWRSDAATAMPALLLFDRCGTEVLRVEGRAPGVWAERALDQALEALQRAPERCQRPTS